MSVKTIKEAIDLAARHVSIRGDMIREPIDWSQPDGLTRKYDLSPFDSCGLTRQQQRSEAIAVGAAHLLGWVEDRTLILFAWPSDPGDKAGAVSILRRARKSANSCES